MAKNGIEGVYDRDPKIFSEAKMFNQISQREVLKQKLQVMDQTAASMCSENKIDMLVFNMNKPGNMKKAVLQESIGTLVKWED